MSPVAHHGERNSPEYLPEVLQALAELRGVAAAELAPQLLANTLEALGMKKQVRCV
jgi:TatD DNase family protein